jgi:NAD(P)-dependent dehydrogenase (short-subunit alcohol dehydrogenase family)
MPPNAAAELQNVSLVGQNKTAVVVDGLNGNGGGIARRLAQLGCSRIIICADDEKRGKEELEVLKRLASKEWGLVAHFLPVYLSCDSAFFGVNCRS